MTCKTGSGDCMSRRFGVVAVVAAMAFLSLVLLPVVEADHAYSHRYVIYGRVVDSDGNPLQGLTADIKFEFFNYDSSCNPNQPDISTEAFGPTYTRPVTNEYGEFIFCMHSHGLSRYEPGTAILRVLDQDSEVATTEFKLDGFRRVSFPVVTVADKAGNETVVESTYTVAGRLWRDTGETKVEGITVFGETVNDKPVNVTLTYNNGKTATVTTNSNGYGDFSVRVPVDERVTSGTVTIESENATFSAPATKAGLTTFTASFEAPRDPFLGSVLVILGTVAAIIVVAVVGVFGYRKFTESRTKSAARDRSTRKRAQR